MDRRRGAESKSSPKAGCDWFCDEDGIHKNLLPFGLRIFLAQRRMFFSRRIWIRLRSEILFELPKIFRNALNVNF